MADNFPKSITNSKKPREEQVGLLKICTYAYYSQTAKKIKDKKKILKKVKGRKKLFYL